MALHNLKTIKVIFTTGNPLKRQYKQKEFKGFDTETEKGKAVVITDSDKNFLVADDLISFLDFLYTFDNRQTSNFFYNLNFDVNALIAYLPERKSRNLVGMGWTTVGAYKISYLMNKVFRISGKSEKSGKYKNSVSFYDIAQFFMHKKLEKAAELYGVHQKTSVEDIKTITYEKLKNKDYRDSIVDYCINDSVVCGELTGKYFEPINKLYPVGNYLSPASLFRDMFRHMIKEPLGLTGSKKAYQVSLNSYHAGYNETLKLGSFKGFTEYDLQSAYPSVMRNLVNPTGTFVTGKNFYQPDAAYSFFKIMVSLEADMGLLPPFVLHKGLNFHPYGDMVIWVTKTEYEFLESIATNIRIIKAYHIMKEDKEDDNNYIFRDFMDMCHNARLEAKKDGNEIKQLGFKTGSNSLYGSLINVNQSFVIASHRIPFEGLADIEYIDDEGRQIALEAINKAGSMFCPPIAAEITAQTRMLIFNAIKGYEKRILKIATDGFFTTKKIHSIKVGDKLGDYSMEYSPHNLFLYGGSRLMVIDEDDNVLNKESRVRGFKQKPEAILKAFKENPDDLLYNIPETHVVTHKESLNSKKYKGMINHFVDRTKQLSIGVPTRSYPSFLYTYNDLLDNVIDSEPLEIKSIPDYYKAYQTARKAAGVAYISL